MYDSNSNINAAFVHNYAKALFELKPGTVINKFEGGSHNISTPTAMNINKIKQFWNTIICSVNRFYIKFIFNKMDKHLKFTIN